MSGYTHRPKINEELKETKFFPVCVDNFFRDPDAIREWGLSLDMKPDGNGTWPGERSLPLHEINTELNQYILIKAVSSYFDLRFQNFSWERSSAHFQKIKKYSDDSSNKVNEGWIHTDGNKVDGIGSTNNQLAGLIYLTPDADLDGGTSLFKLKKEHEETYQLFKMTPEKHAYYKKHDGSNEEETITNISDKNYKEAILKHNSKFEETLRFQNVYNRLILYGQNEFHKANSYHVGDSDRLTLVFFINDITTEKYPTERVRDYEEFDSSIEKIIKWK